MEQGSKALPHHIVVNKMAVPLRNVVEFRFNV